MYCVVSRFSDIESSTVSRDKKERNKYLEEYEADEARRRERAGETEKWVGDDRDDDEYRRDRRDRREGGRDEEDVR